MKREVLNITIKNNDKIIETCIIGKVSKNTIKYYDEGTTTEVKILSKDVICTRKNKEYSIKLDFKEREKTSCIYTIEENKLKIVFELYTKKIIINKNLIHIEYELYNENIKIGNYEYNIKLKED